VAERSADLMTAMNSRMVIDLAAGIIMGQNRCTQDQAISILKIASGARNMKLSAVAAAVITERHLGPGRPALRRMTGSTSVELPSRLVLMTDSVARGDVLDRLRALHPQQSDPQTLLSAVTTLAVEYFDPLPVECGITVHNRQQLISIAHTLPVIGVIEEAQNPGDGGPVLNSLTRGESTIVHEALTDDRWPAYLQMVAGHGYHSILSICLTAMGSSRATLNF
jgi:hypothetical protein